MKGLGNRPITLVIVLVVLAGAMAFAWTRYRAMTGPTKDNSVQLSVDELKEAMRRD